jgi:hypothetical protein
VSTLIFRILVRAALIAALVAVPTYLIVITGNIPLWLNALGFVAIAVATGVIFLNSKRTVKFFTRDVVSQAQVHALSITGGMLAIILGAAAGIHWRTLGHSSALIDNTSTVVTRVLFAYVTVGLFLTAGKFEENLSLGRLGKVIAILVLIIAVFATIVLTDHNGTLSQEPSVVIGLPQGVRP